MDYEEFIRSKSQWNSRCGVDPGELPGWLYDFQAYLVEWALSQGRRGVGCELKPSYYRQAVKNLASLGNQQVTQQQPTLFD